MKLGFVSDVHGNPIALEACLRALGRLSIDSLYFLGDAVGYFDGELEVLAMLREAGAFCQKGNHEAMLLGELPLDPTRDRIYRLAQARARLAPEDLAELASWPMTRELAIEGVRILLAHGSPAPSITEYVYPDTPLVLPEPFAYDVVFLGHSHRPFVRRAGEVTVVNVGSTGLPRDTGDLASCAVFDTTTREARVLRIPFDRERVLATLGATAAPEVREVLLRRQPAFGERMEPS